MRPSPVRSRLRSLAPLFAALAVASCSDRSPVAAPVNAALGPAASSSTSPATYPLLRRLTPLAKDYSVSANVGLAGGVILVPEAGFAIVVPAGALLRTTRVTVTAHAGSLAVYSFAPHGLKFSLPVSMVQLLSVTSAASNPSILSRLVGGYLPNGLADVNRGSGAFTEIFQTTIIPPGLMVGPAALFTTRHFSGYAYGSARSGDTDEAFGEESGNLDGKSGGDVMH